MLRRAVEKGECEADTAAERCGDGERAMKELGDSG